MNFLVRAVYVFEIQKKVNINLLINKNGDLGPATMKNRRRYVT